MGVLVLTAVGRWVPDVDGAAFLDPDLEVVKGGVVSEVLETGMPDVDGGLVVVGRHVAQRRVHGNWQQTKPTRDSLGT